MVACFWPFEFHPTNKVEWLTGENGVRFYGLGTIVGEESFPPLSELSPDRSLIIEIIVRPNRLTDRHAPHILSLCPDKGPPSLVIGAWKDSLIMRLGRPDAPGPRKYRELGVRSAFSVGKTTRITVATGSRGTAIYLNGILQSETLGAGLPDNKVPLGRLLLGVSMTGGSDWQGNILGLTVYNCVVTEKEIERDFAAGYIRDSSGSVPRNTIVARYDFAESSGDKVRNTVGAKYDLTIPRVFEPLRHTILATASGSTRFSISKLQDIFLNIFGFIPFGYVAMLSFRGFTSLRQLSTLVVLAGFSLSLGTELVQIFLPTRSSSLIDLATNTLGSAFGVLFFTIVAGCRRKTIDVKDSRS